MTSGKNNIRVLIYTIIFFLIVINLIFFFQKKRINDISSGFKTESESIINENYHLAGYIINHLEKLHLSGILFSDGLNSLRTAIGDNTFIWIYHRSGCSICSELEFINIKKYLPLFGKGNIIVLTNDSDQNYLNEEMRNYGIKDLRTILLSDSDSVVAKTIILNKSAFFVLDSGWYANMIFQTDPSLPFLSERYFEKVREIYFPSK